MFDAWGKPGPGLVQLYGIFRGEYLECKDVEGPAAAVGMDDLPADEDSGSEGKNFSVKTNSFGLLCLHMPAIK